MLDEQHERMLAEYPHLVTRWAVVLPHWPEPIAIFRWRPYARYVAWVDDGWVVPWDVPRR